MCTDAETITTRLDVVEELTQKEELFQSLRAVLGRFLDVDHLLSMCVQVPKEETIKTTDNRITTVIYLKHTLEEVEALRLVLCATETDNVLLKSYQTVNFSLFFYMLGSSFSLNFLNAYRKINSSGWYNNTSIDTHCGCQYSRY